MSREIPYSPMHPPRKEVSIERMNQILAKHSRNQAEAAPSTHDDAQLAAPVASGSLPNTLAVPLEWEKPKSRDQTALLTKCGRYSCCKVKLYERITYECWALTPGAGWFTQIAVGLPSFDAAKAIAQKHADAKVAKP